ncbi:unnamed protein product [Brachionus calyciflorus]|uniref:Beta-1,4-galactosyltransferase n=1 Tax=Brachionus calyciflorus TaxID=104777 RepID=A0A813UTY4_9BILA|nr:unnamed protein product [Brachionus calyciflorus]
MIAANLCGKIPVKDFNGTFIELEKSLSNLSIEKGGSWSPKECKPRYKVALIIPYRNRENILKIFLKNLHPFLQKQQIEYGIYLIEPLQNLSFNRGLLMNIGFIESLKKTNQKWECFMFHDVDLIPEDDRIFYSCPEQPRHMSAYVTKYNSILSGDHIFGGVSALTKEQMKNVNGYSNLYFGWGSEDDDFRLRILKKNYNITRYPLEISRYFMIRHTKDQEINPERFNLMKSAINRMSNDGLNSIEYNIKFKYLTRIITKYNFEMFSECRQTPKETILNFVESVCRLVKKIFPNVSGSEDIHKVMQERFTEGLFNQRLRETVRSKMLKMRNKTKKTFHIQDLIDYAECKNSSYDSSHSDLKKTSCDKDQFRQPIANDQNRQNNFVSNSYSKQPYSGYNHSNLGYNQGNLKL